VAPPATGSLDEFVLHDLNAGVPEIVKGGFDVILMLDVIEPLEPAEQFLEDLRQHRRWVAPAQLLISTGNVGCCITRAMLLFGQFNYGKRGILDVTHTRLFTFGSLRRALRQAGFEILETRGCRLPFRSRLETIWQVVPCCESTNC